MPDDSVVIPESDVDTVVEGLKQDVGQFVVDVEKFGENRVHITSTEKGPPVYSGNILEYMALAGWVAERTDTEIIDGKEYPVMEFVRDKGIDKMIKRRRDEYGTLKL